MLTFKQHILLIVLLTKVMFCFSLVHQVPFTLSLIICVYVPDLQILWKPQLHTTIPNPSTAQHFQFHSAPASYSQPLAHVYQLSDWQSSHTLPPCGQVYQAQMSQSSHHLPIFLILKEVMRVITTLQASRNFGILMANFHYEQIEISSTDCT